MEQVRAGPPVPRASLYRPAAPEVRVGGQRHPRTRVGRMEWNRSEASGGNPRPRLIMHGHWRLGGVPWAWVLYVTSLPGFRIYTTATAIQHMTCLFYFYFWLTNASVFPFRLRVSLSQQVRPAARASRPHLASQNGPSIQFQTSNNDAVLPFSGQQWRFNSVRKLFESARKKIIFFLSKRGFLRNPSVDRGRAMVATN